MESTNLERNQFLSRIECAHLFYELSLAESDTFKSKAYNNASSILLRMSDSEFWRTEDFRHIDGIGVAINNKIAEYKSTGLIKKFIELQQILKENGEI